DDLFQRLLGSGQVAGLFAQRLGPAVQLVQFLKRFHVDATEPAELAAQLLDFLLGRSGVEPPIFLPPLGSPVFLPPLGRGGRGGCSRLRIVRRRSLLAILTPPSPPFPRGGGRQIYLVIFAHTIHERLPLVPQVVD